MVVKYKKNREPLPSTFYIFVFLFIFRNFRLEKYFTRCDNQSKQNNFIFWLFLLSAERLNLRRRWKKLRQHVLLSARF